MKSIMRLLPFVLGVLIIILLIMHFVLGDGNDDVNTTDSTNKVSETELTLGGNTSEDEDEADPTPTPTTKPKKDKDQKDNNETAKEETTDATPTPIINDNEVVDEDGNIGANGTGNEFGLTFEDKQDFVFIKAGSRIRAGASTDTGIIGEVSEETKLERTGYNSEWTRVVYNDMECYVATSLVVRSTTDAASTPAATPTLIPAGEAGANGYSFETKSDLVEIKAGSRIRSGASTNTEIVAELSDDAVLDRTGYNKEWTRVIYEGKECYVATSLVKRTVDKYGTTVDENGNTTENNDTDNTGDTGNSENGGTDNTDTENADNSENNNDVTDSGDNGSETDNTDNGSGENDSNDNLPVEITFSDKSDYVEIKAGSRIRSSASTASDDNIITTTTAVSRVRRTGSSKEWARVEYNGQTCYISNSVITVSMSEEQAKAADEADKRAAEEAENNNSESGDSQGESDSSTVDNSSENNADAGNADSDSTSEPSLEN